MNIDNRIKQQLLDLPIEMVAERLGIDVCRHHALCFMHDDHHPSLMFFPSKNKWKCYVCDVWGDTISLVMRYNNQKFVEACVWLANNFGIDIEGSQNVSTTIHDRKKPISTPKKNVTPDFEILQYIVDNCGLTETARLFLFEERGYSESVVRKLKICSMEDEKEFVDSLLTKFDEARLLKCQLIYKNKQRVGGNGSSLSSYFHAPCLFFPYYDIDGKIIGLQARYLGDSERHQRFQFPKGSETHIFNQPIIDELSPYEPLFVSEGVTDTIALLSSGYKAIAIPSATLLKTQELRNISTHPLLMYPDNDEPGERLFTQIKESVEATGGSVTRLRLPADCKDFSEFYRKTNEITIELNK